MDENKKKSTCLIGLGTITQNYVRGLEESEFLGLCAVADISDAATGRSCYRKYPFYNDYNEMISVEKPEYVIISTPPESHFEIARNCLEQGVNVIIEKPVTLCMEELELLETLSKEKNLVFKTLFHWHGGIETRAFAQKYNVEQIDEIKVTVLDPYCDEHGIIYPDRRPLMGAWVDSGVNILSMIRLWLPFKKLEIVSVEAQNCGETSLPIYVNVHLIIDGVKTEITIDWRKNKNHKESFVKVGERFIHINHSGQSISDENIVEYERMPRLQEHYCSLFSEFDGETNIDVSHSVHEFLFEINNAL